MAPSSYDRSPPHTQRTMDSQRTMYPSDLSTQPAAGGSSSHGRIPSFTNPAKTSMHKASYSSLSHDVSPDISPDGTHVDHNGSSYEMNSYPPLNKGEKGEWAPPQPSYTQPVGGNGGNGGERTDGDMTATESEDEFDWDEDEEQKEKDKLEVQPTGMGKHRARRGRRVSRFFGSSLGRLKDVGCAD